MNPNSEKLTLRQKDLFWRDSDDGIVVLDGQRWEYLRMNAAGETLWKQLVDGASLDVLAATLVDTFGISHVQAHADTQAFIDRLGKLGLIDRDAPES